MPIENFKYRYLLLELIPEEIIQQYNLIEIAVNGKVYFEICKGMLGLKQAGITVYEQLAKHLNKHGYKQYRFTFSMWRHI